MSARRSEFHPSLPNTIPLAASPTCNRTLPEPYGGVPGPTFWKLPPALLPLSTEKPQPPGLEGETVMTAAGAPDAPATDKATSVTTHQRILLDPCRCDEYRSFNIIFAPRKSAYLPSVCECPRRNSSLLP
jgi:hypothetical protein